MKFTGKDGKLRIYDSSAIIHGQAPLDNHTIDVVQYDGAAWANITTNVEADDASAESAFIADNADKIYIGSTSRFAMVEYLKGAGTNFAAGSGALIRKYYNATDFSTALSGCVDGTASGGDCFAQDGKISFEIPDDWAKGANALHSDLDADKYYIELAPTTSPTTDPDADVLAPVDGQYFEVAFVAMDFSGPPGRPKTEEILVLNRNRMDANAHYVEGNDDRIYEPLPVSFSCLMDDAVNKDDILLVLQCGNPSSARWTATGVSTKGDTKNDGTNANPSFRDSSKKTVNVQILFEGDADTPQGWAYYEVFYPQEDQKVAEAEDGVPLNTNGGCYGVIERIHGFGNRY